MAATVIVSVFALMLFAGYMKATRVGIEYSTIRGGLGNLQVSGKGGFDKYSDEPLAYGLTPAARERIETLADNMSAVSRTVPRLGFSGLLSNGPRTLSVSATGIDPIAENAAFGARSHIIAGSALKNSDADDAAVIGAELAKRLGVKPGDIVTLITTTVNGSLNAQDLTIVGTVSTGIPATELYLLQIKLDTAQALLATDKLSNMAILLNEGSEETTAARAIAGAAPKLEVRTWRQMSPTYDQVVGLYETLFAVFGFFILIVTGFSIAISILTGVLERKREIGVMRSLGISAARVRSIFLLESLVIGGAGLVIGAIVARLSATGINALHLTAPPPPGRDVGYPFRILWDNMAAIEIAVAVLCLTVIASWLASSRVTKLNVITALGDF